MQLFSSSGLEGEEFAAMKGRVGLANHMGLFLQKTNIIRDFLEDINELPAPRYLPLYLYAYVSCTLGACIKGSAVCKALADCVHSMSYGFLHASNPALPSSSPTGCI